MIGMDYCCLFVYKPWYYSVLLGIRKQDGWLLHALLCSTFLWCHRQTTTNENDLFQTTIQ